MSEFVSLLAAVFGLIFVVAGFTKLLDLQASYQSMLELGLRSSLARPVSVALPLLEIALGVASFFGSWWIESLTILCVMLLVFTAVLYRALLLGKQPKCSCFGSFSRERISGATLRRNGLFLILGLSTLMLGSYSSPEGLYSLIQPDSSSFSLSMWLSLISIIVSIFCLWIVVQMLAMLGEIKSQVTGGRSQDYPLAGQSLPPNPVSDTEGKLTDTTIALAAHPSSLVIFSRAECRFCDQLLEQLEELVREESWSPAIVFIWLGQIDEASIQRAGKLATDQYVDSSERIAADLLVQGTPSAIKIIDGRLGNVMALGPDEVLQLARSSLVDG